MQDISFYINIIGKRKIAILRTQEAESGQRLDEAKELKMRRQSKKRRLGSKLC